MRARAVGALALAAVALAGCESTQSKSARLEKEGAGKAQVGTVTAGAASTSVTVTGTTVLRGRDGANAVVVDLRATKPEAAVPIQIVAKDAAGKPLYKNDLEGLQPSLQQMAYVARGEAFWVHDQVLGAQAPRSVDVEVGAAKAPAPPAKIPEIRLERIRFDSDPSGTFATGIVKNLSKVPQTNMPIYGVARRNGKVVAAGRAIIDRLLPEPQKKPTPFRIFFVGQDPKGAQLDVRAVPSTFTGA